MGSKGSQTTSSQSSSSPPPQVLADYQGLVNRATNTANTPYTQYPGELVAPLSQQTQQGLGQIGQYANAAQPFYQGAAGATMAAATPISPTQFSAGQVNQYQSPYTQDVVNATQNQFNNQNQQASQFLNSSNISSGAFGGDRAGVSQAILANQQQTAQAPVIAGLYNQSYNQALSEFNTQQGVGLQAQAFNNQQLGQMGNQLANIGTASQQAGLQGAQAQLQAGMIPQQEQQQIDTSLYNQYLQQQAYPFQTTGWLGNIVEGTGSLSGGIGQSSTTTPAQGNPLSQGLGLAQSGLGILGNLMTMSDREAKENVHPVGKTFDGQTIYRFNYKGDPRTQVGLIAQETEHKHPEAVGYYDGLRAINYDTATRDSANRGHFADGGAPPPQGGGMINYPTTPQTPSSQRFPQPGQQAYTLGALGDPGARAGMGSLGLITGRAPMMSMQGMGGAQGGTPMNLRQGFQSGGAPIDALGDLNSYDPTTGQLNPQAGIANSLYDVITQGSKSPQYGVDLGVAQAIGTPAAPTGTQYTTVPGPAQNVPAIDWQNPGNDFQTAGAEASLQGLIGRPGVETSPSESSPPVSALTSAGGAGGTSGSGTTAAGILPSSLVNNMNAWASGNPVAFGQGSALPGSMSGVSVGDRMANMGMVPAGASPGVSTTGGGGGAVTTANPPRAAVSPVVQAASAAPAVQPKPQIIYVQQPVAVQPQQAVHGGPGAGASGGGGGGGFAFGGPARVYRAAGGQIGQSGMGAALSQPPTGSMVTGGPDTPGFNNMFGGSGGMRPTFAEGGASDGNMNPAIGLAPFNEVVSWVPGASGQIMGKGPPNAPSSTPPPQEGGGGKQPSPGDSLKGLADAATKLGKQVLGGGGGGAGTDIPNLNPDDASDIVSGANLSGAFDALPDNAFDAGQDLGFARGGLIRRKRGHFASGGADDSDAPIVVADADFGGPDAKTSTGATVKTDSDGRAIDPGTGKPTVPAPVVPAPAPVRVAAPAPATAPTPAPAPAAPPVPSSVKTKPIVGGPDPTVMSPAAISKAIDTVWGPGDDAGGQGGGGGGGGGGRLGGPMGLVAQVETGNQDIPQRIHDINTEHGTPAQGNFQIIDPTWRRYAPAAGVDLDKYPTALGAPFEVQAAVAAVIPVNQWGDATKNALLAKYPGIDLNKTLGEAQAKFGGGDVPSADSAEVSSTGSTIDPNALLAPVVGGNKYFSAKDYADPNSSKREFFNALMMGGFAMMGGESRNPWINIGRGEMAGMDYWQKQQELDRGWIKQQADIDHLSADDRRADADVNMRAVQTRLEAMKIKYGFDMAAERRKMDQDNDSAPAPAPTPAPTPTPEPSADSSAPPTPSASPAAAIGAPGEGTSPVVVAQGPSGPASGTARSAAPTPTAIAAASVAKSADQPAPDAQPVAQTGPANNPSDPFWKSADRRPQDTPQYWTRMAETYDFTNPDLAVRLREKAAEVVKATQVWSKSQNKMIPVPGAAEAEARAAGLKAGAETSAKAANEPFEAWVKQDDGTFLKQRVADPAAIAEYRQSGTVGGRPAQMDDPAEHQATVEGAKEHAHTMADLAPDAIAAAANKEGQVARQKTISEGGAKQLVTEDGDVAQTDYANKIHEQRLLALQQIMQRWEPGAWSEHIADIKNILNTVGIKVANTAEAFEFLKNTTGEVFDQLKTQKGAVRNMEIQGLQKANPSTELPAEANQHLISQMLGIVREREDYNKAYHTWRESPEGQKATDPNAFIGKWNSDPTHYINRYVEGIQKNFAYKGQTPGTDDGQLYMMPDGSYGRYSAKWKGYVPEKAPYGG